MTKILLTLATCGFFWSFGVFAVANIRDDFTPTLDGMWWGYLVMVIAGWLFTLKLIWEPE